jgi:hypothetical protein
MGYIGLLLIAPDRIDSMIEIRLMISVLINFSVRLCSYFCYVLGYINQRVSWRRKP